MSIIIYCSGCTRKLMIPDHLQGRTVRCPNCKNTFLARDTNHSPTPNPKPVRTQSRIDERIEPEHPHRGKGAGSGRRASRQNATWGVWVGMGGLLLILTLAGAGIWLGFKGSREGIKDSEWMPFTPPGGRCSILMPGTPTAQPLGGNGQDGEKWLLRRKNHMTFTLVQGQVPGSAGNLSLAALAETEKNHLASILKGQVISEGDVQLGSFKGREFVIRHPEKGTFIGRVFVGQQEGATRLYFLAVGGETIKEGDGEAAKFLNSFQITGPSMAAKTYP